MINRIVITKINRQMFTPKSPISIIIGFFSNGEMQASFLLPASLFDDDIKEGQEIDFKDDQSQSTSALLDFPLKG